MELEDHAYDVTSTSHFEHFLGRLKSGGTDGASPVDLVLSCVDNYGARTAINQACNELGLPWMEAGVSEDAVSGHIQTLLPGRTGACSVDVKGGSVGLSGRRLTPLLRRAQPASSAFRLWWWPRASTRRR